MKNIYLSGLLRLKPRKDDLTRNFVIARPQSGRGNPVLLSIIAQG